MDTFYDLIYESLNDKFSKNEIDYDTFVLYNEMVYNDFISGYGEYTEGVKKVLSDAGKKAFNKGKAGLTKLGEKSVPVVTPVNNAINKGTKEIASVVSGERKARKQQLPTDIYEKYKKGMKKWQITLKTATVVALKPILPPLVEFVVYYALYKVMKRSNELADRVTIKKVDQIGKRATQIADRFNLFKKKKGDKVSKEEYEKEIKVIDAQAAKLAKDIDKFNEEQNRKNGSDKSSGNNINESFDFELSYQDISDIITENGEVTDHTFDVVHRLIAHDDGTNPFYEYFIETSLDVIESHHTYDSIFESIEYDLEDGKITMEDAESLNDLAFNKYILREEYYY